MAKRRTFSPEFKAQIVLEVLSGAKSGAQICREHQIKDSVLSRWKQEFIERAPQLFARSDRQNQEEERTAELERLVGRLTMELEMSKKASLLLTSRQNGGKPW
jgi:transposase